MFREVQGFHVWDVLEVMRRSTAHRASLLRLKQFLYGKLLRPTERFKAHVEGVSKRLELERSRPNGYIGLYVRKEDKLPLEKYRNAVKRHAVAHKNPRDGRATVFLATDDPSIGAQLRDALGQGVLLLEQLRPSVKPEQPHTFETLEHFFTDVALLVNASVFIGTASSNVGRLVYFQREPDAVAESLKWDFLDRLG